MPPCYVEVRECVPAPRLFTNLKASGAVMLCDGLDLTLCATNSGGGLSEQAFLVLDLPGGLTTDSGVRQPRIPIRSLRARESLTRNICVRPARTGWFEIPWHVDVPGGVSEPGGRLRVRVVQPQLAVSLNAPEKLRLGKYGVRRITVTNHGDAMARDVILKIRDGGVPEHRTLGTLAPGASRTIDMPMQTKDPGVVHTQVTASAYCADAVTATATTRIRGVPAVRLEVVDLADPIEVGGEVTYRISVFNQGEVPLTDIRLSGVLESSQTALRVGDPQGQSHSVSGRVIDLGGLSSLPAKATATWTLTARAEVPTDVRTQFTLRVAQFERPITETESTIQYQ